MKSKGYYQIPTLTTTCHLKVWTSELQSTSSSSSPNRQETSSGVLSKGPWNPFWGRGQCLFCGEFSQLGEEKKGRTGLLVSFGKDVPKSPYLNNGLQHAPSLYFPQIWLSPSDRQPTYITNLKRKTWVGLTSARPFFLYQLKISLLLMIKSAWLMFYYKDKKGLRFCSVRKLSIWKNQDIPVVM